MHMLVARRALGRPWSRLAASAPASRAVNRTNAYAQDTLVRALRSRANGARGVSSKATLPNILGGGPPPAVVVETLTPAGLRLADGTVIPGACLFIEGEVLLWDAPPMTGGAWVTLDERELRERFEVFELVVPRPGACAAFAVVSRS
jgi:NADH dehydrogenase [ubiquinone] 1 alpha subcomplex assembly factor 3